MSTEISLFCNRVIDDIKSVGKDIPNEDYTIGIIPEVPLSMGDTVELCDGKVIEGKHEKNIVLMVDLYPEANWAHNCFYVVYNMEAPNEFAVHPMIMPPMGSWAYPMKKCSEVT